MPYLQNILLLADARGVPIAIWCASKEIKQILRYTLEVFALYRH